MAEETEETTEIVEQVENGQTPAKGRDASPMNLIEKAIDRDADIEVLERLFDLQERQEEKEARRAFDAAIADLRDDLPEIVKNREVSYETKKGGKTEYKYEDLGSIVEAVKEPMAEHGLSFRWNIDQDESGRIAVTCILSHRLGHSEETTIPAPKDKSGGKNSIQAIGSTITYLQRYTLKSALGLAASYDDDGQAAGSGNDSSGELSTDPDEVSPPNFDNYEEYDTVSDLPDDELVYLKDYLTGDKLEGEYAKENKALRKAVLNEIKKRQEERKAEKDDTSDPDQDITDAALNLARKEGISKHVLQDMEGTGKDGRIVKGDIQAYLSEQEINSENDSSDELTLNDAMSTIMDDCSELIDDTSASISEIRETLQELGVTESNLDRVIEHLTDVQAGTKSYETEDGVIQLD